EFRPFSLKESTEATSGFVLLGDELCHPSSWVWVSRDQSRPLCPNACLGGYRGRSALPAVLLEPVIEGDVGEARAGQDFGDSTAPQPMIRSVVAGSIPARSGGAPRGVSGRTRPAPGR